MNAVQKILNDAADQLEIAAKAEDAAMTSLEARVSRLGEAKDRLLERITALEAASRK